MMNFRDLMMIPSAPSHPRGDRVPGDWASINVAAHLSLLRLPLGADLFAQTLANALRHEGRKRAYFSFRSLL